MKTIFRKKILFDNQIKRILYLLLFYYYLIFKEIEFYIYIYITSMAQLIINDVPQIFEHPSYYFLMIYSWITLKIYLVC
jgi:hypothetical protein